MGTSVLSRIHDLLYIGVDRSANLYEIRHVLLLNIMVAVLSSFVLFLSALLYKSIPFMSLMGIGYIIMVTFIYYMHHCGLFALARIYFGTLSWVLITSGALYFGKEANMHYYLLFSLNPIFFMHTRKEKLHQLFFVALYICSFLAIEFIPQLQAYQQFSPREVLFASYIIKSGVIPLALIVSFFSFYIINHTENNLVAEQKLSESLLLNILPAPIVNKLKTDPGMVAEKSESGSVLFADIVGFTALTAEKTPDETVSMLNDIFSEFDTLIEEAGLEKIKTIGDAVMVAGGIPEHCEDHLELTAGLALAMLKTVREKYSEKYGIDLRIGIDSGEIIAGVIGRRKFLYDLWGSTVNTASRMESTGTVGRIQVTERVYKKLRRAFSFERRGEISCKGMGEVTTYYLNGRLEEKRDR
jgi:adenylate cyclase